MTEIILIFIARWLIWVLIAIISLVAVIKWERRTPFKIWVTVLAADVIAEVLKYIFKVPRPEISSPLLIFDPAFPSGHTAMVAALGAFVFRKNKPLGILLLVLSLIIGWSRVLLGVHYPLDILGGFAVGVTVGIITSKWKL